MLSVFFAACGSASDEPRFNILWITVEDMSPHLGCYGDDTAQTPNIDQLAKEGIRFTNAYSVSGVCAPSRASLITGMYPVTIGAQHMRTQSRTASIALVTDPVALAIPVYEAVPPPEVKCFPEYLRSVGYYCSNNSKTDYQFRPPISAWDESSDTAHWRKRPSEMPFFSVINFTTTHESQVWTRADDPLDIAPETVPVPPYYPDNSVIRQDIARNYNNIQIMDAQVGEVLRQLEEDGLKDKTIIFFYSDHGDGLPRAKRWLYDSGLQVPLIVRFPDGRGAGSVNDNLVSFVDFAPTVLSLLNLPIPDHMQGQAFLGSQKSESRKYVFAAKDRMDPVMDTARAVRDKRYKYIRNYFPEKPFVQFLPYRDQMPLMQELLRLNEAGELNAVQKLWFRETKPIEELYDTSTDPHEVVNLADNPQFQDKLNELRDAQQDWFVDSGDLGLVPESELVKMMWPPDGVQPQTEEPVFEYESLNIGRKSSFSLRCATEGASIAYRFNQEERWRLYADPVRIDEPVTVSAQAIRIGFKPSEVASIQFVR